MKRILVMSFGSDAGGIEQSLMEFLKFLVGDGHSVDLFLWRKPGILYDKIPRDVNIIESRLYPGSLNLKYGIKHFIWYIKYRICTIMKRPVQCFIQFPVIGYDIAVSYCQNGYSPHYIIDKVQAKKKIMFYHHGSYDSTGKAKAIDEQYYLKYDSFITVSNVNRQMLEMHFPSMKGRISVINNLCDEKTIKELSKEDCIMDRADVDYIFCTVGRISPEKGQTLAIEVARELKGLGLKFRWYFVGDGPDMEKCYRLVSEYGLTENCIFTGMQSNPYPYINGCNLYIQTSFVEADPVTIREAKILHKTIITTDIPAFKEALSNYDKGMAVSSASVAFAKAINEEINSKRLGNSDARYYNSVNDNAISKLRELLL